jgi:hypothetical protein
MRRNNIFLITVMLVLSFFHKVKGQVHSTITKNIMQPFEVRITNMNYSMAFSTIAILNQKELKIQFKGGLKGENDTLLFSKFMTFSDTLKAISEIDIDKLEIYYSNECIDDGSQLGVSITKGDSTKYVYLSNYYQEDIGKIIYLINSLVPRQYKIWYDKEKLIADFKECERIK